VKGETFEWSWTVAMGHSRGTLTGVNLAGESVVGKDRGEFFSGLTMVSREDNFKWELINVYGPVQTERKPDFIQELNQKLTNITWPCIIGGILILSGMLAKNLQIMCTSLGWISLTILLLITVWWSSTELEGGLLGPINRLIL
jgi:hypothetical protein